MEHVVKITSHMKKALNYKRQMFSTFFDIKRAYDSVWHAKLLNKLTKIGITGRMYFFIESFLKDREI